MQWLRHKYQTNSYKSNKKYRFPVAYNDKKLVESHNCQYLGSQAVLTVQTKTTKCDTMQYKKNCIHVIPECSEDDRGGIH